MQPRTAFVPVLGGLLSLCLAGASDCSNGSPPVDRPTDGSTGSACEEASDCYPTLEEGALEGDAECLDRIDGGYCTHECATDDDCGGDLVCVTSGFSGGYCGATAGRTTTARGRPFAGT